MEGLPRRLSVKGKGSSRGRRKEKKRDGGVRGGTSLVKGEPIEGKISAALVEPHASVNQGPKQGKKVKTNPLPRRGRRAMNVVTERKSGGTKANNGGWVRSIAA